MPDALELFTGNDILLSLEGNLLTFFPVFLGVDPVLAGVDAVLVGTDCLLGTCAIVVLGN